MKLISIPTWLITNLLAPFLPKNHPWKHKWFTLSYWHVGQTPLCQWFDIIFWVSTTFAVVHLLSLK